MPRRTAFDPLSAALRLLSFRARSTFELIERLKEKGFSPAAIGPAIEHLSEAGYLNDEAFARELVSTRVRNKAWGRHKIAADLRKRGISSDVAERALKGLDEGAESATALTAVKRWAKKSCLKPPLDQKARERAYRHLSARGFSTTMAIAAVRAFEAGAED